MADKYNPSEFENKWIEKWVSEKLYKTPEIKQGDKKFYSLYSFPYPSGAGLHVGHVEGMVANDIAARYHRMKGDATTLPMGWDSFGLPAENYAIKTGTPPEKSTEDAIKTFIQQINHIGISVDWDKEVGAHRPDYYRWTQWIFLQLYKAGLAYKKNAPVNWCPKDQTVLANEQVINGKCERCDTEVIQKDMEQWFFKMTAFADRLHNDLDKVDWPESTKIMQRNWIGRSEGTRVKFEVRDTKSEKINDLEIFTTRIDTIFGCTFMVIAPEHKLIQKSANQITNIKEVNNYINVAKNKTDLERQTQKEKTGIKLEGLVAINPFNNEEIPIFVSDYVLAGYGTGAIMAVPAHDERDMEFALKHNIPLINVIIPETIRYVGYVARKWSNDFNKFVKNLETINAEFREKSEDSVIYVFEEKYVDQFIQFASESVKGQNAWHDAVSEKEALVIFGDGDTTHISKFMEDERVWAKMKSIESGVRQYNSLWEMLYNSDYRDVVCFNDLGKLINSDIYSNLTSEEAKEKMQIWLKENSIGQKETTYKLRDWLVSRQRYWGCPIPIVYDPEGKAHAMDEKDLPLLLPTDVDFKPTGESPIARSESFKKLAEEKYGKGWHFEADTMDTFVDSSWYYFRFCDPKNEEKIFDSKKVNEWLPTDLYMIGVEHTVLHCLYSRFFTKFFFDQGLINFDEPFYKMRHMGLILGPDGRKMSKRWGNVINPDDEIKKFGADTVRMYEMFMGPLEEQKPWNDRTESGVSRFLSRIWDLQPKVSDTKSDSQIKEVNKLIKKIGTDIENLSFNTAVAKFMEFANFLSKETEISKEVWENYLKLLAPFAPFITEELWSKLGNAYSIHQQPWPEYDEKLIVDETINLAVQVNGKVRSTIEIPFDSEEKDVLKIALQDKNIQKYVSGEPKKVIYVKNKILNIII